MQIEPCQSQKTGLSSRGESLRLLWSTFARRSPLFPLFLDLRCVPVGPCFVDSHETTQKLHLNSVKHCSKVVSRLCLLFEVSKHDTHRADSFNMPKFSCMIWPKRSSIFNGRSDFDVILHGSRFRGTWVWLIKNRRRPCWNLLNQFLMVAIAGVDSLYAASKRSLISLCDFLPKTKIDSLTDIVLFQFFWNSLTRPLPQAVETKVQSDSAELLIIAVCMYLILLPNYHWFAFFDRYFSKIL